MCDRIERKLITGADRAADIILNGQADIMVKGGFVNLNGLADLIERQTHTPDLLESLQATLAHAEDMTCELMQTDDLSEYPYIVRARAVIAKAKGSE